MTNVPAALLSTGKKINRAKFHGIKCFVRSFGIDDFCFPTNESTSPWNIESNRGTVREETFSKWMLGRDDYGTRLQGIDRKEEKS